MKYGSNRHAAMLQVTIVFLEYDRRSVSTIVFIPDLVEGARGLDYKKRIPVSRALHLLGEEFSDLAPVRGYDLELLVDWGEGGGYKPATRSTELGVEVKELVVRTHVPENIAARAIATLAAGL